ncbi:adenylosuccinate synthetase [Plantactinospora endophytica]|uniref:Adenylosuccinate synthetase n=1 Tax=Plantactinospora endophytica TaxID=673535 RepID=A0ABQ4E1L2_9ACTN|nr:adenylosuccinate synthetase [Plantactinospora endophytica]GIG88232.1 adenylosuccinate synthetase [Plantactinospora endophytica]
MKHTVVVDLGYGDAGKGTTVEWLCTRAPVTAVIRFNGGAQAAHNVLTPDGRHHTFAQFGSGTLRGVPTHLSRFVAVDPLALAAEATQLARLGVPDPFGLLTVDGDALLTTPWHRAANQLRELRRGADRHGSCGVGVGETMRYAERHPDAPRVADVRDPVRLRHRLTSLRDRLTDELGPLDAQPPDAAPGNVPSLDAAPATVPRPAPAPLDAPGFEVPSVDDVVAAFRAFGEAVAVVDGAAARRRLLRAGPCVFEGAQGVLLDEWRGWHPYTTWSTTTFDNAATLLAEADESALRLGVVRTYTTRHGAGPFVTEDPALRLPEPHNGTGRWQGPFRVGHFDAVAHRYAVGVCGGVDALAVTHVDAPEREPALRVCTGYEVDRAPVFRLVPGPARDLARQAELTALLYRARPAVLFRPDDWPTTIGGLLDVPVLMTSHGPRVTDKRPGPAAAGCRTGSGAGRPGRAARCDLRVP